MKEIMLKEILCIVVALAAVRGSGDFVILHSPKSVNFNGSEEIQQSLLTEVFVASLGFTVKQRGTWEGISVSNPFTLAEAVVCIAVEGIESLDVPSSKKFPLDVDEDEETTWQVLSGRLAERGNDNNLVRISLADGLNALGQSALGELKPTAIDQSSLRALSLDNEDDRKYLEEVQLLYAIAKKVPTAVKPDSVPDVYWLVVSGLRRVVDYHGKNSAAAQEALVLLNNALNAIKEAFMKVYNDRVVIAAVTNDASQVRHTRSILLDRQRRDNGDKDDKNKNIESVAEAKREFNDNKISAKQADHPEKNKTEGEEDIDTDIYSTSEINNDISTSTEYSDIRDDKKVTEKSYQDLTDYKINSNTKNIGQGKLNVAKDYSADYPVIFNILLWFGVVFVFSLLAICIAIADMDPGRDSIIYRMTSNRMKKDN